MRNKLFRILGFGGLAIFMGVATLLGGMATLPMVSAKAETQQSGLGLDPENDPVVFTTNGGLEIRKHEAVVSGNGLIENTATFTNNKNDETYVQDLRGFYYFTMGALTGEQLLGGTTTNKVVWDNTPVNWVIIGRGEGSFGTELLEEISPAAQAIKNDEMAELRKFLGGAPESITQNTDIEDNCVLVISEKLLGLSFFNSSAWPGNWSSQWASWIGSSLNGNRYRYYGNGGSSSYSSGQSWTISNNAGGQLYNYINSLFNKNKVTGAIVGDNRLGFTQEQAALIRPQQLYTHYSNGSACMETPETDGGTWYTMFPLAYEAANASGQQNFCLEDYLTKKEHWQTGFLGTNLHYIWGLRSGHSYDQRMSYCCGDTSGVENYTWNPCGVRPAMVVEFVPDLIG